MNTTTETWTGRIVLLLCHVAGLLDLVILPLWVGGLIGSYNFDPQLAGGLVTLYLAGIVISNIVLAFRFDRVPARLVTTISFLLPAAAFLLMLWVPAFTIASNVTIFAILNFVGGLGAGAGMAIVHGMIGRSLNPHRLFAFVNFGVGIFGVLFFAVTPPMMASKGVNAVFMNVAIVIFVAALAALWAFPKLPPKADVLAARAEEERRLGLPLILVSTAILAICFIGIVFLQTANAITLSFVERVGNFRGFDQASIGLMLMAGGLVPFLAPIGATILQNKLAPLWVTIFGMLVHGVLSVILFNSVGFAPYAVAYSLVTATVVFTHTFAFGMLARFDPSGHMNALTPTMMMTGSALGPFVGGTIAKSFDFAAVGIGSAICAVLGSLCYVIVAGLLRRRSARYA